MSAREGGAEARSTADAVARRSYGKLVAFLAARTRDMAAAEDALAEAFAAALADWPQKGCPANPEAWLLTVARRSLPCRATSPGFSARNAPKSTKATAASAAKGRNARPSAVARRANADTAAATP